MSNKLDRPLGPTFSDGWLTCAHTSLTGGDDYQMCNHCGFEWDYRRETVAQALVREVVPYIAALRARLDTLHSQQAATEKLLRRYLDNHCQLSDQEGTSTLCECKLCLDTRKEIGL